MRRQPSFTRAGRMEHLMLDEVERLLNYEIRSQLAQQIKVTGGRLSADLGHLRVQFVLQQGGEPGKAYQELFERVGPFLSRTLQETLQLRGRPQVAFHFDRDAIQMERIRVLLSAEKADAAAAEPEPAEDAPTDD